MPKPTFPDALAMRRIKYDESVPAERDRVAEALRAAGRRAEALLLYERTPDHPSLKADLAWAVAEGASFHVLALRKMGVPVTDEEVASCGRAAEARGRWRDAFRCWTFLKDEASLERVRAHLPNYVPAVPANKQT